MQAYLHGYEWRWFSTITFPPVNCIEQAERWAGRFYGLLFRYSRQALGALGFYFRQPLSHCHILITNGKRECDALFDDEACGLSASHKYEKVRVKWQGITQGYTVDIQRIDSIGASSVIGYIAGSRNASRYLQECEALNPLNPRILNRRRKRD